MSARRRGRPQSGGSSNSGDAAARGNRRRRGGGGGGGPDAPQQRAKGGARKSRGRARPPRNRKREENDDAAAFWGDPDKLPPVRTDVRISDDPSAVPRSLGRPPLPGQEQIAEHYFAAVYDRAVTTAGALAAAGGLIDPEALAEELGD